MLVALGAIAGLVASLWLSRFVTSLLYGVEVTDPAMLTGALAVLIGVGFLAASIPAGRATRVDPAAVLREG
jgi:ABC-type antimicrobial peptide transport system permease subunit